MRNAKQELLHTVPQRVRRAAERALWQLGWDKSVSSTRIALRIGAAAAADADCVDYWCATLEGLTREIGICRAVTEKDADVTAKFMAQLAELRLAGKYQLLKEAGFVEHLGKGAFYHPRHRKVLSREAVDDRAESWLQSIIADANDSGGWKFYFEEPPSEAVVSAFLAELDH